MHKVTSVPLYARHEIRLESAIDYPNALQDVSVTVEFACGPSRLVIDAFWDGERTWRARFSPEIAGRWTWRTSCSQPGDAGLDGRAGQFECVEALGSNELLRHGGLRISADRRHLIQADGTPFFWLGDTAWNGPLKAAEGDWSTYLADRFQKGFNAIQFVATQWISATGDAEGRPAYLGSKKIRIEPAYFRRLDRRVDMINAFGMIAAPVLAWAAGWNSESVHLNPGNTLPDDQLVLLVKYLVSRYGAHQAVWILAGDGIYEGEEAERWRRIGRAALKHSLRLATMHPGGKLWVASEFRGEPWFSFNSYQSGHWNDEDNARWINEGPIRADWQVEPLCPHINLEPVYEGHRAMTSGEPIDAHDVRRASYWSLLAAPPAGVSYGAHGVWSWESTPELPLSHPHAGIAVPWSDAMHFPGSASMAHLKAIMCSLEWWRLNPCPELLLTQPGIKHPMLFIACACSADRDLAIIYAPEGGTVSIAPDFLVEDLSVTCLDPSNGAKIWQRQLRECAPRIDSGGPGDSLLVFRRYGTSN